MITALATVDLEPVDDFAGVDIPDDAPPELRRELLELKALNEWKYGGTLYLFAHTPVNHSPLWGWLRRIGRKVKP